MREEDIIICGHGSGTPSTKNMYSYLDSRYNSFATNGVRKGLVAVKRLKMMNDELRAEFAKKYSTILGRNIYSQDLRQFVYSPYGSRYYSDCSSSICATYQQIGCDVSLLNTAGIYYSNLFADVPVTIVNGHILNIDVLKVGDCLLFAGNDPNRPKQIGHVEAVYQISNSFETVPVEATLMIETSGLNVRLEPTVESKIADVLYYGEIAHATAKNGEWFKIDKGWISRKYVSGWVKESNRYWYINKGTYPVHCAMDINGQEYHFDKDGWMIEPERVSSTGAIIY